MIKKENRLRKNKEIENVFKNGKSFYNDLFGFKVLKNDLDSNRFCVIISAKVSKKAVDRNRFKRIVKAVFLEIEDKLKNGFDYLIVIKKEFSGKSFFDVKKILEDSFKKMNFL
ncbi:MAG: ribonuclease P protein component [Patescibacteria group bacterium]|jgi:ribonuclease P protein component